MTKRDIARIERKIARDREDLKRLSDFAEGVQSFTPQSDGSGQERNAQLRRLDDANRRTPGFPSQFGRLARAAAKALVEPVSATPSRWRWVFYAAIGGCGVVLGWAFVEWTLVNTGWVTP